MSNFQLCKLFVTCILATQVLLRPREHSTGTKSTTIVFRSAQEGQGVIPGHAFPLYILKALSLQVWPTQSPDGEAMNASVFSSYQKSLVPK